jgi:inward rectifier potassium channel
MPATGHPDKPHEWQLQIGHRRIFGKGLPCQLWRDFFHLCMTLSWPRLLGGFGLYFLLVNLLFSILFWSGANAVIGQRTPTYLDVLFFSFEVFGTVSFGGFQPGTPYGHLIATLEILIGIGSFAVMTGLTFARFTRPQAHLLFTAHPLIRQYQGKPTLMLRIANTRHNFLSDAQAKFWFMANMRDSATGVPGNGRGFFRLRMLRDDNPIFALSWTLYHVIEADSPLQGMTVADFAATDASIAVIVSGYDENYGQEVRARHVYHFEDFRWDHDYADIMSQPAAGVVHVDYSRFHETYALHEPTAKS